MRLHVVNQNVWLAHLVGFVQDTRWQAESKNVHKTSNENKIKEMAHRMTA